LKLKEIYELFIREGSKSDLRNKKQVQKKLLDKRREYKNLSSSLKQLFDKESLKNPYADTRILFGDPDLEVRRILVGIDIEASEMLLAEQLNVKGGEIDLVLAHHPEGIALAGLYDVMHLQTDVLQNLGIDERIAKDLMERRIKEVSRRLHAANHTRCVDAAKLLNIPLMCCHTPADNHVARYLQNLMDTQKPKTLQSIIDLLLRDPEYQDAVLNKAGPKILIGESKDNAGRVFVDMTGGTEGSKEVFARMSQLGIQTLLGMHLSEEHFKKIKSEHIHVVIAGHMASDNLGMNLLLDKLEKKAAKQSLKGRKLEIKECSGFKRVKR
jgi:putative NIF3 family GTP cyclohydrolase 1 type 2